MFHNCVWIFDIHSGFDRLMSDGIGEHLHIHSVMKGVRCEGVSKCVKRYMLALRSLKDFGERFAYCRRISLQVFFLDRRREQPYQVHSLSVFAEHRCKLRRYIHILVRISYFIGSYHFNIYTRTAENFGKVLDKSRAGVL